MRAPEMARNPQDETYTITTPLFLLPEEEGRSWELRAKTGWLSAKGDRRIMNVMLVSVTERTQEVGLRKAIGATNRQILRQFMTEALVLSVIGALLGVILAVAVIGFMRLYTSMQPSLVWQSCVIVPAVAVVTGVLFGTFPAVKASMKDPIDALRRL